MGADLKGAKINIRGFDIEKLDMEEALCIIKNMFEEEGLSLIVTANPEILEAASKDEELASVIRNADMVLPDGVGLLYASRIKGEPLRERITGIDIAYKILEYLAESGKSVYLLGAKPGVAERAAENLKALLPGLIVAGTHDGYFKSGQEKELVAAINSSGADFLCVALGAPKQELFLARHKNELTAKVGIGIGGSLDIWSGDKKRAPEFWQRHGAEWLYRLVTEPSRFVRMLKLPLFLLKVIFDK